MKKILLLLVIALCCINLQASDTLKKDLFYKEGTISVMQLRNYIYVDNVRYIDGESYYTYKIKAYNYESKKVEELVIRDDSPGDLESFMGVLLYTLFCFGLGMIFMYLIKN